jgi:hypothetical protein
MAVTLEASSALATSTVVSVPPAVASPPYTGGGQKTGRLSWNTEGEGKSELATKTVVSVPPAAASPPCGNTEGEGGFSWREGGV